MTEAFEQYWDRYGEDRLWAHFTAREIHGNQQVFKEYTEEVWTNALSEVVCSDSKDKIPQSVADLLIESARLLQDALALSCPTEKDVRIKEAKRRLRLAYFASEPGGPRKSQLEMGYDQEEQEKRQKQEEQKE